MAEDGTPMSDERMAERLGQSVEGWRLIKNHYEREQRARREWEAFAAEERAVRENKELDPETRSQQLRELAAKARALNRIVPRPAPEPPMWDDDDESPTATDDEILEEVKELRDEIKELRESVASGAAPGVVGALRWVKVLLFVLVAIELYRLWR